MAEHTYKLQYVLRTLPGIWTKEEIAKEHASDPNVGGTDALFIASVIYPDDGSLSVMFSSMDGRTKEEMTDAEWFKVWAMLTARLARSKTLASGKRELCQVVHETIAAAVTGKG